MSGLKRTMMRAGLTGAWMAGAHLMARPFLGGVGVVLMLHSVRPEDDRTFHPNRILEVTPEFLEAVILRVRAAGLEIIDLDEAHRRMTTEGRHRRFAVLTFDDGYRDNLLHALPVLKRHKAKATIYIPSAFPDGRGELWWLALEEVIAARDAIAVERDGKREFLGIETDAQKERVYDDLYWWLRDVPERDQRAFVRDLAARYDVDLGAICRREIMTWSEVVRIAEEPEITIGAHTVDHFAIGRLSEAEARSQMRVGADVIASVLGRRPTHFSFPYGSTSAAGARDFKIAAELGFKTAVTTRPGVLYAEHGAHLTALPRLSLNGDFQSLRYLDVLMSGLPFFVLNGFGRLNVS